MKNSLSDLNNYLFEQIERINDDELSDEQLEKEIKRAETVTKIGQTIISNAQIQLNAWKEANEYGLNKDNPIPGLLLEKREGGQENSEGVEISKGGI